MRQVKQTWAVLTQEVILRKPVHDFHICCQFDVFGPVRWLILPYDSLREMSKGTVHLPEKFLGLKGAHHGAQGHKDKTRVSKLSNEILKFLERVQKRKGREKCCSWKPRPSMKWKPFIYWTHLPAIPRAHSPWGSSAPSAWCSSPLCRNIFLL